MSDICIRSKCEVLPPTSPRTQRSKVRRASITGNLGSMPGEPLSIQGPKKHFRDLQQPGNPLLDPGALSSQDKGLSATIPSDVLFANLRLTQPNRRKLKPQSFSRSTAVGWAPLKRCNLSSRSSILFLASFSGRYKLSSTS